MRGMREGRSKLSEGRELQIYEETEATTWAGAGRQDRQVNTDGSFSIGELAVKATAQPCQTESSRCSHMG